MGLMQQAYKTYCKMEKEYAGKYLAEKKEPLAPVSHLLTSSNIEITLDSDGNFISAAAVDKSEGKIIIPVTENSAGRAGIAPCAHPLSDQLCYVAPYNTARHEVYFKQLEEWANSEFSHSKVTAVYKYVKNDTIIKDLCDSGLISLNSAGIPEKEEKHLIRWRIFDDSNVSECWKDATLFDAFIRFYDSVREKNDSLCMVTGSIGAAAVQHPKGVVPFNGNAKIISANDKSGFTYRGRFVDDKQAVTVGYEASQMSHCALRWLVVNQGVTFGSRTFLCWNPEGEKIDHPGASFLRKKDNVNYKATDYQSALQSELLGLRKKFPAEYWAVVAAFDAATTGRLALTFYSELPVYDFFQRMHDWDYDCCWYYGRYGQFGIQAPSLLEIVDCAYGIPRKESGRAKFVTDDKLRAEQLQRMVSCKVDKKLMPLDIMRRLVSRTSMPQVFDEDSWESLWNKLLYVTCAVIQKYHSQKMKGELCMSWDLDYADRSFQFGRLLAVMEKAENDYYSKSNEERMTNAIKSMSQFRQTPWRVFERVNAELEKAYLPRVSAGSRHNYYKLREEIVAFLSQYDKSELNKPLNEFYLMGYSLQRNTFYKSNKFTEEINETEETEE